MVATSEFWFVISANIGCMHCRNRIPRLHCRRSLAFSCSARTKCNRIARLASWMEEKNYTRIYTHFCRRQCWRFEIGLNDENYYMALMAAVGAIKRSQKNMPAKHVERVKLPIWSIISLWIERICHTHTHTHTECGTVDHNHKMNKEQMCKWTRFYIITYCE